MVVILNDPANLEKLNDSQLEESYWETVQEEENIKAQKLAIREEFVERVKKTKQPSGKFGESIATRYPKIYTGGVTVTEAEKWGAVKTEVKVDGAVVSKLYKAGNKIEGVEEKWEIKITKIKKEDAE